MVGAAPRSTKPRHPSAERRERPAMREVGVTGTVFFGGYLQFDDTNPEWRDLRRRCEIIDEMMTDPQVASVMLACKMPILTCQWHVSTPKKSTKLEKEQAEFIEQNLFSGMTQPWVEILSNILTYFDYGFFVGEKTYRYDQMTKKLHLKKIAPRLQKTIYKWNVEDDGGVVSVVQRAQDVDGHMVERAMGIDRLAVFSLNKRAGNWEGQTILRSAYKPWYIKDKMYRIDAIAHERHGVGIPKVKLPPSASKSDYATVRKILENVRAHDKGYVIEPDGFEFSMVEYHTLPRDPMNTINHHDNKISSSMLGSFLNLGFSSSGSRALGDMGSSFFLSALQAHTAYICGIFNRHVIKQIIDLNWGKQERYPELRATPTGGQDIEKMAKALMMMTQNDLLYIDKNVVEQLHRFLGLPQPDYEEGEFISERHKQATAGAVAPGTKPPKGKLTPAAGPDEKKPKPKAKESE